MTNVSHNILIMALFDKFNVIFREYYFKKLLVYTI